MDELTLLDKFNKLIEQIPEKTLANNFELLEYRDQLRHELSPKDPKGGRPKTYQFNGRITVWLVDNVHDRLIEMGIRNKQLAYKMVAWHYKRASQYSLKRYYDHWKHELLSAETKATLKKTAWSEDYFQTIYKKVQN